MPDDKKIEAGATNLEAHNKDIADKLAAQDAAGHSMAPVELKETGDALDELAKAAEVEKKSYADKLEVDPDKPADKKDEVKPAASGTPPVEPKPPTEEEKKKLAEEEEDRKKADEFFKDAPSLPANASPKSSEAFSGVKIRAVREISAQAAKIEELTKQVAELSEKSKNSMTPELERELVDNRTWRAKLDLESDPKFKEFDKEVTSAQDFVYAQLKKSPAVTDEIIAQIKKYGGPENVKLEKIFEAIKDPTLQRLIESKVADIEQIKWKKEQAVNTAKQNIQEYLATRSKEWEQSATHHNKETSKHLNGIVSKIDWFREKPVDPKSDEATRKAAEEHNKFIGETKAQVQAALSDDSPEMRAIMLAGMAQLFYHQKALASEKASHEATKKEIETTKTQLAEVTAKYEKLKNASVSRLRESGAPSNGKLPETKPENKVAVPTTQALDDIAKQVMEERERVKVGA